MTSLYLTLSLAWHAVRAYKITGPAVFEETNSDHYIKLYLTQLFTNLQKKKRYMKMHSLCKEMKNNFQSKINISTQDLHCMSRSTARSFQACLEVAIARFVCNKLLMKVAVLR